MECYVELQYYCGCFYIGEYLDEVIGYWLKGDQECSCYYNYFIFNDLMIIGLIGFCLCMDNIVEVNLLIFEGKWDYFCLDNVLYYGCNFIILWDKDGSCYQCGKGLYIYVDGKEVGYVDILICVFCENVL